ncbi:MAG: low molecular weight phosphotyrosine protein phosphatase [Synergistaceae bacterium]|nr:low molecular weight phosphotyrosine protein phosphatase [Synergistaceae bacterium]
MAEFIMKELVRREKLEDEFLISSAATTNDEIGSDMYPNAKNELKLHSIPFERRRARRITRDDYETWDYIIAMDQENLQHLRHIMREDSANKIKLLMSFAGENREVSDPWYTRDFSEAYCDIYKGCEALLKQIKISNEI